MMVGALLGLLFGEKVLFLKPVGEIFIRLLIMGAIPLVFFNLLAGLTGIGNMKSFGSIGIKVIIYYCLSLIPVVVSLYLFDEAGILYLLIAGGLTVKFLWDAVLMYGETENQRTMPFFHYSCFYTFGIFGALTCDRLLAILLVF